MGAFSGSVIPPAPMFKPDSVMLDAWGCDYCAANARGDSCTNCGAPNMSERRKKRRADREEILQ